MLRAGRARRAAIRPLHSQKHGPWRHDFVRSRSTWSLSRRCDAPAAAGAADNLRQPMHGGWGKADAAVRHLIPTS